MKLETYVGPMQGSTAGIIWDLLFLNVPGIGINPESLSGIQVGTEVSDIELEQLHVEDEGGVWRDDAWVSFRAIGIVRGAS